jgi:hypothetical protein
MSRSHCRPPMNRDEVVYDHMGWKRCRYDGAAVFLFNGLVTLPSARGTLAGQLNTWSTRILVTPASVLANCP